MSSARVVKDVMSSPAFTLPETATVEQAAREMQSRKIGAIPVVDASGKLAGIISDGDFTGLAKCVPFTLALAPVIFGARAASPEELARIYDQARHLPLKQVMTTSVVTARPDETVGAAVQRMVGSDVKHLPIVDHGRVVGILARHDLVKLLAQG